MKEVSQITLQLKDSEEKTSLHRPFHRIARLDKTERTPYIPLSKQLLALLFKHAPYLIPKRRKSAEAKMKTAIAYLLRQEKIKSYLLDHRRRREQFLKLIKETALETSAPQPRFSEGLPSSELAHSLTTLDSGISLLTNDKEFFLQEAILPNEELNHLLYHLLARIEREPILSTLEAVHAHGVDTIQLMTKYMKYKIFGIQDEGQLLYDCVENQTTSSIRTKENILQGEKGAVNQRFAYDYATNAKIGYYAGELSTSYNILEQILLIIGQPHQPAQLSAMRPANEVKSILFTSLFSWTELELISKQRDAIYALKGKTLTVGERSYELNLLHYNVPFSCWNRLPTPAETGAIMNDFNDETLIWLTLYAFQKLKLPTADLETLAIKLKEPLTDYIERQKHVIHAIDTYRKLKPWIISSLMQVLGHVELVTTLLTLLTKKRPDQKILKGIDELLYLDLLAKQLGFTHSKNCQSSTQRSAGAKAADKAQTVFQRIHSTPFLPGKHTDEEMNLFQSLYSIYLLWEEPEVNALLSTGSEKTYARFLQKNPETTRYLIS